MNRAYILVAGIGIAAALVFGFMALRSMQGVAEDLQAAATRIGESQALASTSAPQPGPTSLDAQINDLNRKLDRSIDRVRTIKDGIQLAAAKGDTLTSLSEAQALIQLLQSENKRAIELHDSTQASADELRSKYEAKIAEAAAKLESAGKKKQGLSFEFATSVISILTTISTLLMAWRKEFRESDQMRLQLAKLQKELDAK